VHRFRITSLALELALALACLGARASELDRALPAPALADKAVIILSVTHEPESSSQITCIVDGDSLFHRQQLRSGPSVWGLGIPDRSDFEDRAGHLYVLELKPGHHKIMGWNVPNNSGALSPASAVPALEFDVAQGEALYLGNVDAMFKFGRGKIFKQRAARGVDVMVQDRSTQDIALAESRYPALAGHIRTALVTQGAWMSPDGVSKGPMEIAMPFIKH
jgi:hypothetical protein